MMMTCNQRCAFTISVSIPQIVQVGRGRDVTNVGGNHFIMRSLSK